MSPPPGVVLLIATLPDRTPLLERALASVVNQIARPDATVLIGDGTSVSRASLPHYWQQSGTLHCLVNRDAPGAANSWNSGIRFIAEHWTDCYIAMLDDDDEWDANHLSLCLETARQEQWPDVVISGLRVIRDGAVQPRDPICAVSAEDFLIGNPGWQGSNTFIRLSTLIRAGCFTPNLKSCNDRDLAVRVLSLDGVQVAFTGNHTASWYLDSDRICLSGHRSQNKLDGLANFYQIHGHRMSADAQRQFFSRAAMLFGWERKQILQRLREYSLA